MNKSAGDHRLALRSIADKLFRKHIKLARVVSKCEMIDRNEDGYIHIDDLEDIFGEMMGNGYITQREMRHLSDALEVTTSGKFEYRKIFDALDIPIPSRDTDEQWFDEEPRKSKAIRGSVGEWLESAACPAEAKNFRTFINCLEEYERISGMKCHPTSEGFTVPLGPDLRAKISFNISN